MLQAPSGPRPSHLPSSELAGQHDGVLSELSVLPSPLELGEDKKDEKQPLENIDEVLSVASLYSDSGSDLLQDLGTDDPFPEDPDAPEGKQFTFRAALVGCALGAVISASKYGIVCASALSFTLTRSDAAYTSGSRRAGLSAHRSLDPSLASQS